VADLVKLFLIGVIDLDLNRFPNADGTDSLESQMFHGMAGGNSSWIKDGGFRHDGDDGFHEVRKIGLWKRRDKMKIEKGGTLDSTDRR